MRRPAIGALLVALWSGQALAYVRTSDPATGECLFWTPRTLRWWLNDAGSNDTPFNTLPPVQAAIQRSFQTWQDVECTDLAFDFAGTTSRFEVGFDPDRSDNINLLLWREVTCAEVVPPGDACQQDGSCPDRYNCWDHSTGVIALTTTSYNRSNGEIVDADIEFNGSADAGGREFRFTATEGTQPVCGRNAAPDSICVSTDIQNTATHEIGHLFGLAHSPVPDATMFASAAVGETSKRTLAQDDIDGICDTYPTGRRALTCEDGSSASVGTPGSGGDTGGCDCSQGSAVGAALLASLLLRVRRKPARA